MRSPRELRIFHHVPVDHHDIGIAVAVRVEKCAAKTNKTPTGANTGANTKISTRTNMEANTRRNTTNNENNICDTQKINFNDLEEINKLIEMLKETLNVKK